MPNWKKVIISGSDASLNTLDLTGDLTATGTGSFSDGRFSGNVGIGTTSPSERLDVDGKIRARSWFTGADNTNTLYSSTSTGVYLQGSSFTGAGSVISFRRTDGSIKAVVNTETGNVGIGTTSPSASLQVKGSGATSATDALLVENSSGTDLLTVRDDGRVTLLQTGFLYFGSAQALALNAGNELRYGYDAAVQKHTFYTNSGTAQLHITNDDKVGIGTTNPSEKLTVEGNISGSGDITTIGTGSFSDGRFSGNVGIGSTSPDAKLVVTGTIKTAGVSGSIQTSRNFVLNSLNSYRGGLYADLLLTGDASDSLDDVVLYSANGSIHLTEGATTNKVLTVSGSSVGIGTNSPDYKLDVAGEIGLDSYLRHNGDADTFFGFSGNDEIKFRTAGTDRLLITSNGNVGIGTTSPSEKLDVDGNAVISGSLELYNGDLFVSGSTVTSITPTGEVVLGYESQPVNLNRNKFVLVNSGTAPVAVVDGTLFPSAHFDYVIVKGTNLRAGTVMACHDGFSNVVFTEVSTADLGSTAGVTLDVIETGGNLELRMTVPSTGWNIKTFVRAI